MKSKSKLYISQNYKKNLHDLLHCVIRAGINIPNTPPKISHLKEMIVGIKTINTINAPHKPSIGLSKEGFFCHSRVTSIIVLWNSFHNNFMYDIFPSL